MEDQGKRILLFVVIAAAIFVVFQWVSPAPEKTKRPDPTATAAEPVPSSSSRVGQVRRGVEPPPAPLPPPTPVAPGTPGLPGTVEQPVVAPAVPAVAPGVAAPVVVAAPAEEQIIKLETKGVDVTFSNLGGVVKEWRVRFDSFKGRDMDETQFVAAGPGRGLVATNFLNSTHVLPVAAAWKGEQISPTAVRYTYRDEVLEIVKDYELLADDFLLKVKVDVRAVAGDVQQQLALSLYSAGDGLTGPVLRPACHLNGTASSMSPRNLVSNPREQSGRVRFVGLSRSYSMIALSPKDESQVLGCFRSPLDGLAVGSQVDLVYPEARFSAADKGGITKELVLYVGPKYFDRLEGADKIAGWSTGMKSVIDLGWFSFIARPMLWLLHQLFEIFGNWGVAIILLTFLVKLATLYWTTKSMKSMKAMAALKPEMEAIAKRYPEDRTKQQQAQMALFKQHGVSPLAGCLPMLLQMPIWIALYRMLSSAGELHQATFIPGWLDDLTRADPYFILPLTLTGMMFLQSKIQPATGDSMQQKILMYGMPLMFGGMSLFFPSGLTVYIFTNTFLGIMHTLFMNRKTPAKAAAEAASRARIEAMAKADAAEAPRLPREVKQAKRVVAEVVEGDDDDGDAGGRPSPESSKAGANGASRSRTQRRGKRR